jgi:hypothetical protein
MNADFKTRPEWLTTLRSVLLLLGGVHVTFFLWVIVQRFRFPVELEWMSGGVADHVERVIRGEPIYVAPSARFVPYLYPPLHYWLTALLTKVLPFSAAGRAVSVVAAGVTAGFVFLTTKRLGTSTYWALVATALYFGAYSVTGFWYDLDRADSLALALLSGAFLVGIRSDSIRSAALSGVLFGIAFFAKQPASVFLGSAFVALLLARKPRLAIALAAGAAAIIVPGIIVLNARSDGWFWFYCIKMPASHGIDRKLLSVFFVLDVSKMFAIVAPIVVVLAHVSKSVRQTFTALPQLSIVSPAKNDALFCAAVLASFVTSMTSRLHAGGFVNVLMFVTTFGSIAFGVVAARACATSASHRFEGTVAFMALLQLVHMLYDPEAAQPNRGRVRDAKIVEDRIRTLEQSGEVIVHGRAHLTEARHFHIMALMDVLRAGLPLPEDLRDGLATRRYSGYVIDELGELGLEPILGHRSELYGLVLRNYFVAQRFDDREPPPVVGWIAHPSWLFRPRKTPLSGFTDAQLARRLTIETGIAEMRMRAVQAGARAVDNGDEVETMAALIDTEEL